MTDHNITDESRVLLEKDISFQEVNQLNVRSDWEGIKSTAIMGASFMVSIGLMSICRGWNVLFVPCLILHAFFLSFLFMPLHECVHRTAFKTKILNQVFEHICGFLTLRPPFVYKLYHFAHHKYTGNVDKDPELQNSFIDPKLDTLPRYLLFLTGIPFWIDIIYTNLIARAILGKADAFYMRTPKAQQKVVNEARLYGGMYFALALLSFVFATDILWIYWVLPSVLGQPFLRFYLLAEHTGCKQGADMLQNTRTTKTSWVYTTLGWNMPYHAEHHAFPGVPFHALPKLHKLFDGKTLRSCTPTGQNGYIAVNRGVVDDILHPKQK